MRAARGGNSEPNVTGVSNTIGNRFGDLHLGDYPLQSLETMDLSGLPLTYSSQGCVDEHVPNSSSRQGCVDAHVHPSVGPAPDQGRAPSAEDATCPLPCRLSSGVLIALLRDNSIPLFSNNSIVRAPASQLEIAYWKNVERITILPNAIRLCQFFS